MLLHGQHCWMPHEGKGEYTKGGTHTPCVCIREEVSPYHITKGGSLPEPYASTQKRKVGQAGGLSGEHFSGELTDRRANAKGNFCINKRPLNKMRLHGQHVHGSQLGQIWFTWSDIYPRERTVFLLCKFNNLTS